MARCAVQAPRSAAQCEPWIARLARVPSAERGQGRRSAASLPHELRESQSGRKKFALTGIVADRAIPAEGRTPFRAGHETALTRTNELSWVGRWKCGRVVPGEKTRGLAAPKRREQFHR